jgi:hypothetical protein
MPIAEFYHIELSTGSVISEVTRKVRDLGREFGLNVFPAEAKS